MCYRKSASREPSLRTSIVFMVVKLQGNNSSLADRALGGRQLAGRPWNDT